MSALKASTLSFISGGNEALTTSFLSSVTTLWLRGQTVSLMISILSLSYIPCLVIASLSLVMRPSPSSLVMSLYDGIFVL